MTAKTYMKSVLLASLVLISLGGFLLHLRIHPPLEHSYNFIPYVAGLLGMLLVPCLLSSRKTLDAGYILNGLLVIVGTITMAHFSFTHWPKTTTFQTVLCQTTLADILILGAKLFIGKAVYDLETHGVDPNLPQPGTWWRYPCLGWWLIHLAVISAVYALGHCLWRCL
ncbi:MAG: hypothetical protein WCI17_10390 [bacterium]